MAKYSNSKIAAICETFVNNPDLPLWLVAEVNDVGSWVVSRALDMYYGKGKYELNKNITLESKIK